MKKRFAFILAISILLVSGCAKTEPSSPADDVSVSGSVSEAASESDSTVTEPETNDTKLFTEPLFRESSLFFDKADNAGAEDNFLAAASTKKPRSATDLKLEMLSHGADSVSYELKDIKANAFVDFRSDEDISVLVDPAYMYNIPLPCLDAVPAGNYTFDINGERVVCDSLFVKASSAIVQNGDEDDEETVDYRTDGYCYAAVTMDITITANADGIEAAGKLTAMDKISDDTATMLDVCFLGDDAFDEKSADAAETYKTLLSVKDKLTADDIMGVNLIDLDFDGKPEVLIARLVNVDGANEWNQFCDVDIYSMDNSQLVYVDTLYNDDSGLLSTHGNILGLKTLENGDKAWYTMSRFKRGENDSNPADYIFTMKDGKLEFTEIFSSVGNEFADGEESDVHYYMNGEEIQFGVNYDYFPYYDPNDPTQADEQPNWPYYTYGEYTASFGRWEIYGWLREAYCKDMTQTFLLYSDEFSRKDGNWDEYIKLPVTDRMVGFKLANLTDAYYFGSYDPTIQNFNYIFLGDYAKPVIYLYPEETTDVTVKIKLDGELTCTYPDYRDGWDVTASPDGTIVDKATGKEYYCLYWEGESSAEWDMSRGSVVSGNDTAQFLDEKLAEIGLNARERNEFIIYWLPRMQENKYNYITFHTEDYSAAVPLEVDPQPDSVLRVFMIYASVPEYFETVPQYFYGFERNGFTLVEWGGGEAVAVQ